MTETHVDRVPTDLQGAVHHAYDVVELLVVQHGSVLQDVLVQLLSQTDPSGSTLQRPQHSWHQLEGGGGEGEDKPVKP